MKRYKRRFAAFDSRTGHQNINPANSFVKPFAGFSFMRSLSGQLLQNAVKMQSITPLLHPEITTSKELFPFP